VVRTFDIERSLVFDRRIAVYCAEGDDGIVRILKLEIEL